MSEPTEPYVRNAPRGFFLTLAASGPAIVVAGSVMGAGEIINTPLQAAKFGFVLLWVVIIACVIKYFLQVEIARHALIHNRTTFEALNLCPGPRLFNTSWIGIVFMVFYMISMVTIGAILSAIAGLLSTLIPLDSFVEFLGLTAGEGNAENAERAGRDAWAVALLLFTLLILWKSIYHHLERLVAVLVGVFSVSVAVGLVLIQGTEHAVTSEEVFSGLTFSLGEYKAEAAFAVISLMGALGTTANELFMYPYWILEKGYHGFIGQAGSPGWEERARGWIRVIRYDAGFATLLATIVTAAYFLLGSAILFRQGITPEGPAVVDELSSIYTTTYGGWARGIFYAGAFCTLFSTLVVATAATGRMWADLLASLGVLARDNERSRQRCHQIVQAVFLLFLLVVHFFVASENPGKIVKLGQYLAGIFNTPVLMLAICWIAFQTDRRVRMGRVGASLLLGSVLIILICLALSEAMKRGLL